MNILEAMEIQKQFEDDLKELTTTVANKIFTEFVEEKDKNAKQQKILDNYMTSQLIEYLRTKLAAKDYQTYGVNGNDVLIDIQDTLPLGVSRDYCNISKECLANVAEMFGFKSLNIKSINGMSIVFKIVITVID